MSHSISQSVHLSSAGSPSQHSLRAQLYQITKNKKFSDHIQYVKSSKSSISNYLNESKTSSHDKSITSIFFTKTGGAKSSRNDMEKFIPTTKPTTPQGAKAQKFCFGDLSPRKGGSSLQESKANLSAQREAYFEMKLTERKKQDLSIKNQSISKQEEKTVDKSQNIPTTRREKREDKSKDRQDEKSFNIEKNEQKRKERSLKKSKSPTDRFLGSPKEKAPAISHAKKIEKKNVYFPQKNQRNIESEKKKSQANQEQAPSMTRRRSKSVLITTETFSTFQEKFQGIVFESDSLGETEIETPRLPFGEKQTEERADFGKLGSQEFKAEKQKDEDTIRTLREEIAALKAKYENGDADLVEMTPRNSQGGFTFTLNNLNTQQEVEMKQREIDMLKMQIDTLNLTINFLKSENGMLKETQTKLSQYKEAAKKYREVARAKTEECLYLKEQLLSDKPNQLRRHTERFFSLPNSDQTVSTRKSLNHSKSIDPLFRPNGKSFFKSLSSLSIGSLNDTIVEAHDDIEATPKTDVKIYQFD